MKRLLEEKGVNYYTTSSGQKASTCERFQYSLQLLLYKFMTHYNTYEWTKFLDDALSIYHNREHRSIGMSPNEGDKEENESTIRKIYHQKYREADTHKKKPKYSRNQTVRISIERYRFIRGYYTNFTEEFFYIDKVLTNQPIPRYKLRDYNDQPIKGVFYENELSTFNPGPDFEFKIEKVLKRRGRGKNAQSLVKWVGWDNSFNSWIPSDQVSNIN